MSDDMHVLTDLELSALVAVSQAHGVRTQARRAAREIKQAHDSAHASLRSAESSARMFGNHDDCGSEYNDEYKVAKGAYEAVKPIFDTAVYAEIVAEKAYTKAKADAIARFPALERHIVRLMASDNAKASIAA